MSPAMRICGSPVNSELSMGSKKANEDAAKGMEEVESESQESSSSVIAPEDASVTDEEQAPGGVVLAKDLGPDDVLLGRGTGPNDYEGNVRFRALIREIIKTSDVQDSEDSKSKTKLATKIVETVKERNGRFLQKTNGDRLKSSTKGQNAFVIVPDKVALDKTKQSLRHQLRVMIDPNFKENREKRLKLKKLREAAMLRSSAPAVGDIMVNGSRINPLAMNLSAPYAAENHEPVMSLLYQRAAQQGSDASIAQLLFGAGRQAAAPATAASLFSSGASDSLSSAVSKLLASRSAPAGGPSLAPSTIARLVGAGDALSAYGSAPRAPPATQLSDILSSQLSQVLQQRTAVPSTSSSVDQALLAQLLAGQQQQQSQLPVISAQAILGSTYDKPGSANVDPALLDLLILQKQQQSQRVSVLN